MFSDPLYHMLVVHIQILYLTGLQEKTTHHKTVSRNLPQCLHVFQKCVLCSFTQDWLNKYP